MVDILKYNSKYKIKMHKYDVEFLSWYFEVYANDEAYKTFIEKLKKSTSDEIDEYEVSVDSSSIEMKVVAKLYEMKNYHLIHSNEDLVTSVDNLTLLINCYQTLSETVKDNGDKIFNLYKLNSYKYMLNLVEKHRNKKNSNQDDSMKLSKDNSKKWHNLFNSGK